MEQQPGEMHSKSQPQTFAGHATTPDAKGDQERSAFLERLKTEIASGKYRVPAVSLAAKLMRSMRWR